MFAILVTREDVGINVKRAFQRRIELSRIQFPHSSQQEVVSPDSQIIWIQSMGVQSFLRGVKNRLSRSNILVMPATLRMICLHSRNSMSG